MTLQIGILLALTCAFVSNLGFFFKHRGACECQKVDIRHPLRTARDLYSSKWFAIGMAIATSAWIFHVAALAIAPISVVQMVLAGGVVMVGIMADRLFGVSVGRRQWIGLALTAGGLVLLALTFPSAHGAHSGFSVPAMVAFEAGLFGIGGLLIMGPKVGAPAEHHGVMLGAAAGVLFGVSDVSIKALTGIAAHHGMLGILMSPWLGVTMAASVVAFYSSARGMQEGDAVPVIAITGTAANITSIAAGIIVFGDPLPGTTSGIVLQAVAFVLVIVASALTPAPGARTNDASAAAPATA